MKHQISSKSAAKKNVAKRLQAAVELMLFFVTLGFCLTFPLVIVGLVQTSRLGPQFHIEGYLFATLVLLWMVHRRLEQAS